MWAKGAAVGNAQRCPRLRPVRRRRIVHMSIACRARSARPPAALRFFDSTGLMLPPAAA